MQAGDDHQSPESESSETLNHDQQRDNGGNTSDRKQRAGTRKGRRSGAPAPGDLGLTGLNQDEPIPEVELDADDQAQAREALELLDRFEAESGETLDENRKYECLTTPEGPKNGPQPTLLHRPGRDQTQLQKCAL